MTLKLKLADSKQISFFFLFGMNNSAKKEVTDLIDRAFLYALEVPRARMFISIVFSVNSIHK